MARGIQLVEDEYIDMDINTSTTFLCYTIPSPPHSREFEFQMSTHKPERDATTFPADELFYKGKLLPLHLPPRLQMVEMLLRSPHTTSNTAATTPFESCNISPANSCCVSGELNRDDYLLECSNTIIERSSKKSWSKRFKSLRQYTLAHKLKASRAYLKSLFVKSGCSDESCMLPKPKECSDCYTKPGKRNAFGLIKKGISPTNSTRTGEGKIVDDYGYRRSFSGVIKWHSTAKFSSTSSSCSSSSSSSSSLSSSAHLSGSQMLKRSGSMISELESSIQGAIAYCKESQQPVFTRKSVSGVELWPSESGCTL